MPQYTIPSPRMDLTQQLTADEQAHSERLQTLIRAEIERAGGWIDFQTFMSLALYAPGLGYYSAGTHKFGAGGDFTTAPEVSSLFSRCLARQCAQVLQRLEKGYVLELGAGSGVMARDILCELERMGSLPERYYILEVSADLRARQQALLQQALPHHVERVQWLEHLPTQFVGVVVANEVLDALPVQLFCIERGQVRARGVSCTERGLVWQTQPAKPALLNAVQALQHNLGGDLPDGYCSEVNLQLPAWIQALSDTMHSGVILFIDYGLPQRQYYNAERTQGTLSCFFRQRMHDDPLINVGLQDITALVDFTSFYVAGLKVALELKGFATQAHFLFGAGLQTLLSDMSEQSDEVRWQLSQQVQKLTLPDEMGESFKAMALAKQCDIELSGFAFRDLRERL